MSAGELRWSVASCHQSASASNSPLVRSTRVNRVSLLVGVNDAAIVEMCDATVDAGTSPLVLSSIDAGRTRLCHVGDVNEATVNRVSRRPGTTLGSFLDCSLGLVRLSKKPAAYLSGDLNGHARLNFDLSQSTLTARPRHLARNTPWRLVGEFERQLSRQ